MPLVFPKRVPSCQPIRLELHRTWEPHDASTLAQFIEQSLRGTVVCPTWVGRRRLRPYRPVNDLSGFTQVNEQRRFRTSQLLALSVIAAQAYRRVFRLSVVILIQDAERSRAKIDFIGVGTKQHLGFQQKALPVIITVQGDL